MKKYTVGDIVMVPVKITEVHSQGFKLGLHPKGGPKMPSDQEAEKMSAEEFESYKVEQPDTVIGEFAGDVEVDAAKRLHFGADSEF